MATNHGPHRLVFGETGEAAADDVDVAPALAPRREGDPRAATRGTARRAPWAGLLFAALLLAPGALSAGPPERATADRVGPGPAADPGSRRAVALTFDDLPATAVAGGDCDAATLLDLNRRLLAHLARFEAPATGLVTASRVCDELRGAVLPAALALWLDAGHDLGNHTFSHPDLDRTELEAYESDVIRGEAPVRRLLAERGRALRYFRHPLLHTGADRARKEAVDAFLAGRGYIVAPVTIDNQEWIFAAVYARAKQRGDGETMRRVASAYLPFMEEVFAFFEGWSREVVGREIPQVLLLHANELNADHLDELLGMMRRRGYVFVTLDDALRDEAYRSPDGYVGPRGLSWLHRWALARGMEPRQEPREPEWLSELLREGRR